MARKKTKFYLLWPNFNVKNIRPITKYSYFIYRVYNHVVVKFDFASQLVFLPDVTSLFVG